LGLLAWVRSLPEGWSTRAGADGAEVSGGQRQRLLLARALLADPDVLVLDEPTAHLDPDTERLVIHDLLRVTRGRTVLLSTHRTAGLEDLDAVLLVEAGLVRPVEPAPAT
jgi:ABC-type bacteriocin/lantibiotic exporter with double-glycine peptidase domain